MEKRTSNVALKIAVALAKERFLLLPPFPSSLFYYPFIKGLSMLGTAY